MRSEKAMSRDNLLAADPHVGSGPDQTIGALLVLILACHIMVDMMAALLPSTLGLLEARLSLPPAQSAWLLGFGSLCSGLVQPVCAFLSDRFATRRLGVMGVLLTAIGIGSLGLAGGIASLVAVYAMGMIGVGMFHPFGAATVGSLRQHSRTSAMSIFFVAGMLGGVVGAFFWPRLLATSIGFELLPLAIVPVLFLVILLRRQLRGIAPPRAAVARADDDPAARIEWAQVALLFVASALRFCVNMALVYLYVRWAEEWVLAARPGLDGHQAATAAAPLVGNFNAATLLGMASGGLLAGLFVRSGREKWPLVLVPISFAPLICLLPHAPLELGYLLAVAAGIGFAAMIPVTIALAQQLMPGHTNLASGLMMGGAWSIAMAGPRCAEYGVAHLGLEATFVATAAALALAGILCLPLPGRR
jgi:MFS transporter, FSR family, fosmidomycin resistance protein